MISRRLWFLLRYLDLAEATGEATARWDDWQLRELQYEGPLAITNKSRQVGWSWLAAAGAVADAAMERRSTSTFVSINLAEAKEKIRYARQVIEALPRSVRPKLIIENATEIELENGSRLISLPCRPLRGKARVHVYLDEFAHYPMDRRIYLSALPATSRGGKIRIGSSPLGASGMFWEVFSEQLRPYPGYHRRRTPWWCSSGMCTDPAAAAEAARQAPMEEVVEAYASERLRTIHANMLSEDFLQEYCLEWVDESVAWISWEELRANQGLDADGKLAHWMAEGTDNCLRAVEALAEAVRAGEVEGALAAGCDIGRKRNATEVVVVGKATTGELPYRLGLTLVNTPFDQQLAVLRKLLELTPVTKLLIDSNGLGMQLAETLSGETIRAEGYEFTSASKEILAVGAKLLLQRRRGPLPMERELSYQVHSIKRRYSAGKHAVFDSEASEKHHADKFWGLALAYQAAGMQTTTEAVTAARESGRERRSTWQ